MNEQQRMQYMEAMGIEMFVPRLALPNALLSIPCPLPIADSVGNADGEVLKEALIKDSSTSHTLPDIASGETSPADKAGMPSICWEDEIQKHKPTVGSRVTQNHIAESPSTDQAAKESEVEWERVSFTLHLWHLDSIMVVDSHQSGDALPTERLLTNMLISAGLLPVRLPSTEALVWPLVNSRPQDQSWLAARQMVSAFVDSRLSQKPVKQLLLLGENAYNAFVGNGQTFADRSYQTVSIDDLSLPATVLPSLAKILYEPTLKRKVWRALQPLVQG